MSFFIESVLRYVIAPQKILNHTYAIITISATSVLKEDTTGENKIGQDTTGQDTTGQNRTGQDKI